MNVCVQFGTGHVIRTSASVFTPRRLVGTGSLIATEGTARMLQKAIANTLQSGVVKVNFLAKEARGSMWVPRQQRLVSIVYQGACV